MLQQMAKALQQTQLQNNLPGSKQQRQRKCTKWDNYSAQWLGKGFGCWTWKKKSQTIHPRKVVRTKTEVFTGSIICQIHYPLYSKWVAIQLAPTILWSKKRKADVNVTGNTLPSFLKAVVPLTPTSLSRKFLWVCNPWASICVKPFSFRSVCSYTSAETIT